MTAPWTDVIITPMASFGTINVNVPTPPDGRTFPSGTQFCIRYSQMTFSCSSIDVGSSSITAPDGTYAWSVHFPAGSDVADQSGSVIVPESDMVDVNLALEARGAGDLLVRVNAPNYGVVPDGTEVCVTRTDVSADPICQTVVNNEARFGELPEGVYSVRVTPPDDSGYAGTTQSDVYVPAGRLTITSLSITSSQTGQVEFNLYTADVSPIPDGTRLCWQPMQGNAGCVTVEGDTDGWFQTMAPITGEYYWSVVPPAGTYNAQAAYGGTVSPSGIAVQRITLTPVTGDGTSSFRIWVSTSDGSAVPAGTEACASSGDYCQCVPVVNDSAQFFEIPQGPVSWTVTTSDSRYYGDSGTGFVTNGPSFDYAKLIHLVDGQILSKSVNTDMVVSGDSVTFTLTGAFPGAGFQLVDVLPQGFEYAGASCRGEFVPATGWDSCGVVFSNGSLVVTGYARPNASGGDYTVTIYGNVVGDPGDVVTNEACIQRATPNNGGDGIPINAPDEGRKLAYVGSGDMTVSRAQSSPAVTIGSLCDSASVEISGAYTIQKDVDKQSIVSGDTVTYTITGDVSSGTFVIGDALPASFTMTGISCTGVDVTFDDPTNCITSTTSEGIFISGTSSPASATASGTYSITITGTVDAQPHLGD